MPKDILFGPYSEHRWSVILRMERRTVIDRAAKYEFDLTQRLTLQQICKLYAGDRNATKTRMDEIALEREERENKKEAGELVNVDEALQRAKEQFIIPFKTSLLDLARRKGFEPELKKLMQEFQETK
jgi:hypothetical protein